MQSLQIDGINTLYYSTVLCQLSLSFTATNAELEQKLVKPCRGEVDMTTGIVLREAHDDRQSSHDWWDLSILPNTHDDSS